MRAVELEELALAVDTRRQVGARVGLVGVHAGRLRRGTRRIGHIDISVNHLTTATIDTIMAVVAVVAIAFGKLNHFSWCEDCSILGYR